jgi:hypothetical protein
MIVIYVNHLIFIKFDLTIIFWLNYFLNEQFEINNLNLCIYYFDMKIFENKRFKLLILN